MAVSESVKHASIKLSGTEIRCQNKVLKTYYGEKKLKTCNTLMAVINTDLNGSSGAITVHVKCPKANCGNMTHHTINA